jgi:hypothetical protein
MADYYPLINKAVAGLDKSTGEARRALYERARTALVTQLRGVQPALSESDITRERLALEEAIRKVEAEAARKSRFDAPPERKRADRSDIPDPFKAAPPKREPERSPPDDEGDQPDESESTLTGTAADLRRPVRTPPPPPSAPPSRTSEGLKEFRNVVADAENLGDATAQAGRAAREAYNAVPSSSPEFDRLEPRLEPEGLRARDRRPAPREQRREPPAREPPRPSSPSRPPPREPASREPPAREPPPRERPPGRDRAPPARSRDSAPARQSEADFEYSPRQERGQERGNERGQERGHERANEYSARDFGPSPDFDDEGHAARETGLDREPPQRQRSRRRETVAAEPDTEERPVRRSRVDLVAYAIVGVILLLAVGGVAWKGQDIVAWVSGLMSPVKTAQPTTQPPAPAPPRNQKFNDRVSPSDAANQGQQPNQQAAADVAQKVVLYEEDPEDSNGKRFVGSAVWRTETVARGANQPPDIVVRADIDIPERKMAMKWTLQRNVDKTLPASHTVEVVFTLPQDFAHGGVQNVPGVLMKESEQARGLPLAGLAVKVTDGYFLIGLSAVDSEMQRNIQLLKDQPWFDVPLVYNDGRRAILAVEKGTPGERALNAAFAAWKQ